MFFPLKRLNVAVLTVMSGLTHAQLTYAEESATIELDAIEITSDVPVNEETKGTYLAPVTSGSTGLQLTQKETPQTKKKPNKSKKDLATLLKKLLQQ